MTTMVVTVTAEGASVAPSVDPGPSITTWWPSLPLALGDVDEWLTLSGLRRSGDWTLTAGTGGGLHVSATVVSAVSAADVRHTCNDGAGPHWGRRTRGCPRCDALEAGAQPAAWAGSRRTAPTRSHRCDSGCGPVCTAGDW